MIRVTKKYKDEKDENLLRRFKRRCEREGLLKDIRKNEFYVKPSERRRLKRKKNRARAQSE